MARSGKDTPHITDGLVEYLLRIFPDKAPRDRSISQIEVGATIGQQEVIDHIKRLRSKQDEL